MVMVSAGDLMALYMGLELQSLALYVIAALRRDSINSTEAGLKYFVLGALSSGLLLYGASLSYGYAGTTGFSGIIESTAGGQASMGLLFGLVFVIAGLGVQSFGCAISYVDAGRLRGCSDADYCVFCHCPKNGGDGAVCPGSV